MSFATMVKGKESTVILNLISIFGVIEDQQLRELFDFMSGNQYLHIIKELQHNSVISWSENRHFIFSSRPLFERIDIDGRILCFSAFKYIKNNVREFSIGPPPTVVIVSNGSKTYDLIPIKAGIEAINAQADLMPDDAVRFLVGRNLSEYEGVVHRFRNDFAALVTPEGKLNLYEL